MDIQIIQGLMSCCIFLEKDEKGRSVMECLGVSYPCVPHASSDLPLGIPTSAGKHLPPELTKIWKSKRVRELHVRRIKQGQARRSSLMEILSKYDAGKNSSW
jgi:hypothetical protein